MESITDTDTEIVIRMGMENSSGRGYDSGMNAASLVTAGTAVAGLVLALLMKGRISATAKEEIRGIGGAIKM